MARARTLNSCGVLKEARSTGWYLDCLWLGSDRRVMIVMTAQRMTNAMPMRFRKPMSGRAYFKIAETGIVNMTADNAAVLVVRFQARANKKIAITPGVRKPVYS